MLIEYSERFEGELFEVWIFIADDSIERADSFKEKLKIQIDSIPSMPYKHRKSIKVDDENVRDLIYKGYVVPYRIKEDVIEIIGIFSHNEWDI